MNAALTIKNLSFHFNQEAEKHFFTDLNVSFEPKWSSFHSWKKMERVNRHCFVLFAAKCLVTNILMAALR